MYSCLHDKYYLLVTQAAIAPSKIPHRYALDSGQVVFDLLFPVLNNEFTARFFDSEFLAFAPTELINKLLWQSHDVATTFSAGTLQLANV